jgi:hypothetical protein
LLMLLDNKYYTVFMTIITVFALFGDDLRIVACPISTDRYFYSVTIACMFFFGVECILASIAKPDYFVGFYFWLDVLATMSLIFDVGFLWDEL